MVCLPWYVCLVPSLWFSCHPRFLINNSPPKVSFTAAERPKILRGTFTSPVIHHVTPCSSTLRGPSLEPLSKADPHCAVALLGEVPPWGVMLRLGDHACCQLLCNVRAELSRSIPDQCRLTKDGRAPPHQGRPREKREGGEQSSTEMSSGSPTGSTPGEREGASRATGSPAGVECWDKHASQRGRGERGRRGREESRAPSR